MYNISIDSSVKAMLILLLANSIFIFSAAITCAWIFVRENSLIFINNSTMKTYFCEYLMNAFTPKKG